MRPPAAGLDATITRSGVPGIAPGFALAATMPKASHAIILPPAHFYSLPPAARAGATEPDPLGEN